MANKKFTMVIDLQKCVGCGACAIACKTENNTQQNLSLNQSVSSSNPLAFLKNLPRGFPLLLPHY